MGNTSSDCIVTVLERKTGFVQIGRLPDQSTAAFNKKTLALIRRNASAYKTHHSHHGTDCHPYRETWRKLVMCIFYFATPHYSWERGSHEKGNGLIRQYLPVPKGSPIDGSLNNHAAQLRPKFIPEPANNSTIKLPGQCTMVDKHYGRGSTLLPS